ncbi:hypothetical protein QBC46DRAFT_351637 [Diplogelasinospora grovesii]|uniref:DUF7053 domain-containing protein n=1 Tax=Diplogelasinospora grovesii TaxID=303347 RepID=A0AAN6NCH6_9PEZI|nr:hypothetical protein QBC46DRAFT_351637 [Diplogelasinospora grovesii]
MHLIDDESSAADLAFNQRLSPPVVRLLADPHLNSPPSPGFAKPPPPPPSADARPIVPNTVLDKTWPMPSPQQNPGLTVITRVPLPAYLTPQAVLEALHTYEPLIVANPYLKKYERRPVQLEELVNDAFFKEDGFKLQAFIVHDRVPIIPGVGSWATKDIVIPCVFQSFEHGVRCRADAQAGVTVRSSYEVRRAGEVQPDHPSVVHNQVTRAGAAETAGDYELVEIATIECGSLVKPFVKRSFSNAHQEVLQRVVDEIVRTSQTQYVYQ